MESDGKLPALACQTAAETGGPGKDLAAKTLRHEGFGRTEVDNRQERQDTKQEVEMEKL
jgi:hypothetical protein